MKNALTAAVASVALGISLLAGATPAHALATPENERLSRAYLVAENPERNLYPPQLLNGHCAYLPKAV